MEALDGNAIAGELYTAFGKEMTTASGRCMHCGARSEVAELVPAASGRDVSPGGLHMAERESVRRVDLRE